MDALVDVAKVISWRETKVVFKLVSNSANSFWGFVEEKQKLYLNYLTSTKKFVPVCWRETKVVFKWAWRTQ